MSSCVSLKPLKPCVTVRLEQGRPRVLQSYQVFFCHKQKSEGDTKLIIISAMIGIGFALTLSFMPCVVVLQCSKATQPTVVHSKQKAMSGTHERLKVDQDSGSTWRKPHLQPPANWDSQCQPTPYQQAPDNATLIQGERHDCDVRSCHHCQAGHTRARSPDVSVHSTFIISFAVQTQEISLLSRTLRILFQPF